MLIIAVWMLGFAIIHSISADKRVKRWFAEFFGEHAYEGFYRLIYNIVAMISIAPLLLYMWSTAKVLYSVPDWLVPVFAIIQLIGSIGFVISIIQIDWARFAGIKQLIAYLTGGELPLKDEPLQLNGLYAWVRHPLYFFSLLTLWFSPSMTDSALLFNLASTIYFVVGSRIEEGRMLEAYGEIYDNYRQRVPWLIPFLRLKN
jgi:protein-S-isoprenylcysteine O-methyltransferase Ste14